MRGRILLVVFWFCLLACSEEKIPAGIYDYQVERLLSGGSEKTWGKVISSMDCADSVKLHFELVTNSSNDSLDIYRLTPISNCTSFDSTLIGRADASSLKDSNLFTDSLVFASGDFWLINLITSEFLSIDENDQKIHYNSN